MVRVTTQRGMDAYSACREHLMGTASLGNPCLLLDRSPPRFFCRDHSRSIASSILHMYSTIPRKRCEGLDSEARALLEVLLEQCSAVRAKRSVFLQLCLPQSCEDVGAAVAVCHCWSLVLGARLETESQRELRKWHTKVCVSPRTFCFPQLLMFEECNQIAVNILTAQNSLHAGKYESRH